MFISEPNSADALAYLEQDKAETGYVMNMERAWAWRPDFAQSFSALRKQLMDRNGLSAREIAVLVCATARSRGDSYCSLAWGARLADLVTPAIAAEVLRDGDAAALSPRERALGHWAGQVVGDPNGATQEQIDELRKLGISDREIFEVTAFIALRLAFSTVNDALGAQPDRQLVEAAPPEVQASVRYGRPPSI
jgi:uncharacterized peroxidase-related enzyme